MAKEAKKDLDATEPVEAVEPTAVAAQPAVDEESFAKAGKKSKKHTEEVKAEEERQARKADAAAQPEEKKAGPRPIARTRLERRGKAYKAVAKKVEAGKVYSLKDAVELAIATNPAKFDATVEMHFRLGVDPRQADQNIRATVSLPAGTGKTVRVAVFAPLDIAKQAKAAGADIAEDEEFTKRLEKEQLDFDILISTPQYMPKLGKFARLLGPKGLMPNPKAGTVTMDVTKAVNDIKAGKIEYRLDKTNIIHVPVGKASFTDEQLNDNFQSLMGAINKAKPASLKGQYIKSATLTSTMGPGVKLNVVKITQ